MADKLLRSELREWSELPVNLLYDIMSRFIFFEDLINFGAVCVSWKTAVTEVCKKSSSSPVPFLLIPSPTNHEQQQRTRSLYNISIKKVCDFQVKVPHNKFCRGSSFGWLITMQREEQHGYNCFKFSIQLHNPFLSDDKPFNIINLPPLDEIVKHDGDDTTKPFLYLRKAVLSSDPLFPPNDFVVMSIVSAFSKLAFYRMGDKDWTPIQWGNDDCRNFDDVIYSNKSQLFYAVFHHTGSVVSIDLNTGGLGITSILTQVAPPVHKDVALGKRYLVETSSGDLLQVTKEMKTVGNNQTSVMNFKFEVFMFDPIRLQWFQIYNIGDTILFLGDNCSIARSASCCPGCKPNSIYYTYDLSFELKSGRLYGPQDTGIYNLETRSIQPHYQMESMIIFPTPIWFEPTMGRCIQHHFQYLNKGCSMQT